MPNYLYANVKLEEAMKSLMERPRIPNSGYTVMAVDLNFMSIYFFQAGENRLHAIVHTFCRNTGHSDPHNLFFVANHRKGIFAVLQFAEDGLVSAIPAEIFSDDNYSYHASYNFAKHLVSAFKKLDGMNGCSRATAFLHREITTKDRVDDFLSTLRESMSSFKCRDWSRPIHLANIYAMLRNVNHQFRFLELHKD